MAVSETTGGAAVDAASSATTGPVMDNIATTQASVEVRKPRALQSVWGVAMVSRAKSHIEMRSYWQTITRNKSFQAKKSFKSSVYDNLTF